MAGVSIKKTLKSKAGMKAAGFAASGDPIPSYVLQDNEDGSFTVFGVNAAGNQVDISSVATLTPAPTSSDTTVLTVDPPVGMTVTCHAIKAGHADVSVTATWNDGSVGPYFITVPADVSSSGVIGIGVTFGTPTIRV